MYKNYGSQREISVIAHSAIRPSGEGILLKLFCKQGINYSNNNNNKNTRSHREISVTVDFCHWTFIRGYIIKLLCKAGYSNSNNQPKGILKKWVLWRRCKQTLFNSHPRPLGLVVWKSILLMQCHTPFSGEESRRMAFMLGLDPMKCYPLPPPMGPQVVMVSWPGPIRQTYTIQKIKTIFISRKRKRKRKA